MPHRTMGFWLGILGVMAVAVLLLIGRNLDRAATSGPRWKRRLVAAGLALLAVFGYQPALKAGQRTKVRASLAVNRDWQWLIGLYRWADKVARSPAFSHPFTAAEKRQLLADLARASHTIDNLYKARLLTQEEAALLKAEFDAMAAKAGTFRPKPVKGRAAPTCYKPAPPPAPYRQSAKVLKRQIPLLRKMVHQKTLHPEVLTLIKGRIERDIANAEKAKPGWKRPARGELSRIKKLGRMTRYLWNRLWRRVPAQPQPKPPVRIMKTCYLPAIRKDPPRPRPIPSSMLQEETKKRLSLLARREVRDALSPELRAKLVCMLERESGQDPPSDDLL